MKKFFSSCILLLAVFANCNCFSQTPNYLWAKSAGGNAWDYGYSCSTDASGNIIATGSFDAPSITLGTFTLTNASAGLDDIFIVKYDPSGNVLWAKSVGGTGNDQGYSCSTDASGNIIATGYFWSPTLTLGTYTLTNADVTGNTADMFIVKYDPSGNVLWAKRAGGTREDVGNSCSADASGNIIATGNFQSSSITLGTYTLTNADVTGNTADIFIVKYNPSGNVLWAKRAGGTDDDYGLSCSADANGNIIATGYFVSPSLSFGTTTLTNAGGGNPDIFIVKYDTTGNALWAKSAGGTDQDYGLSCSADANGNIIATGYFWSPTITFGTTTLTNAGTFSADLFIVKYDSSGNVLWAKSAGGMGEDRGYSCSTDASGNIIATGYFQSSSISFGTTTLTNVSVSSADIFIVKYDPSGNVLWAKSAGGTGWDSGLSCSADASGNIIATGYFNSPSITFGTTTLNANGGSYDIFIVKLDNLTGIEKNNFENGVQIYPNPSSGELVIENKSKIEISKIEIYNLIWEKVQEETLNKKSQITSINVGEHPDGNYVLKITTERGIISKQITKQ